MTELQEHCFGLATKCCQWLKDIFSSVGTTMGDIVEALHCIEGEVDAFENVKSARGYYCAMIGSQGINSVLEKAGCSHVKTVGRPNFGISIEDIKKPTRETVNIMKHFFTLI